MPRPRRIEPFYLVLIDREKKIFNIVGPMVDDRDWNKRITQTQSQGRNVGCFTWENRTDSKDQIIVGYKKQYSEYQFSDTLITNEPEDISATFKGVIPNYAEGANRKRLIKIFCKNGCGITRWAEMTVDFPGQEILQRSQLGDFEAICLKCNKRASDCYNWHR